MNCSGRFHILQHILTDPECDEKQGCGRDSLITDDILYGVRRDGEKYGDQGRFLRTVGRKTADDCDQQAKIHSQPCYAGRKQGMKIFIVCVIDTVAAGTPVGMEHIAAFVVDDTEETVGAGSEQGMKR